MQHSVPDRANVIVQGLTQDGCPTYQVARFKEKEFLGDRTAPLAQKFFLTHVSACKKLTFGLENRAGKFYPWGNQNTHNQLIVVGFGKCMETRLLWATSIILKCYALKGSSFSKNKTLKSSNFVEQTCEEEVLE